MFLHSAVGSACEGSKALAQGYSHCIFSQAVPMAQVFI